MPVGVLESLAGERRATGGRAHDEAARHLVGRGPHRVAGALEAEHRVEDVDRDERLAVRRVLRAGRGERREGARLVDADVHDLALRALLVRQKEFAVDRRVLLAIGVVDLGGREVRVHAERARLIRDDRHDAVTEVLRAQQVLEQARERHGRGDLLLARTLLHVLVRRRVGQHDLGVLRAALRHVAAERAAALLQVLDGLVVLTRVVERRLVRVLLEHGIRHRDAHDVAELLEHVERHLLHLVRRVATLEARTQSVPLDGLREDDGGLPLVLRCGLERGIHLAVVVATALEVPELVVGVVLDELERARVAAEEVLAYVRAGFGLVGLVVAVGSAVHQVDERAVRVALEQLIPLAAPHDLDDVPARAAEEALELLDDLAVAAHRPVEPLEVAVDHEVEVVEAFVGRPLERAAALDLVHLAVAEEGPHLLVGRILDAAVGQVAVRLRLVDGVDRPEAHRHGRELPEVGHETRVRVARQAVRELRLLLAESLELVLGEPALEERTTVHAGGGVALVEDLVAAAGVICAAEEPVVADFVEGRG